ncbi:hypothetical protein JCM8547_009050 [Rhodosporidiobolus lusitaniae]
MNTFDPSTLFPNLRLLPCLQARRACKRGERVHVELGGELHPYHKPQDHYLAPGWYLPEFSLEPEGRFPHSKVQQLVKLGAENGVEVVGLAVDVLPSFPSLYAEWKAEVIECLVLSGENKGGKLTESKEFLGVDAAKEVLEER